MTISELIRELQDIERSAPARAQIEVRISDCDGDTKPVCGVEYRGGSVVEIVLPRGW